ncbi:alpha/beta fold hydrolase [Sphingobium boeckii]|uniref:Pimeloyl-ACP methyl ester carboxylesterase n=1 Tax=Sphingobium boeckii TaxID=1082345 RepID=A0A7W9AJW3_9SPHN|nr:alpha/beta hydrolase [Sphingobium boeckii]MBB5686787.1 pimeloyl-ACP methyl ester carboxylesterase [Sphingobium boeckii]
MAVIERLTFRASGVDLVADAAGPADGAPVLFLHGSGQTRQSWTKALAEAARRGYRGISVDMRGHGDSGWSPDGHYDLLTFADDLRALASAIGTPPIVVGASLGGLAGMLVAASDPDALRALVLVDITARVEVQGTREVIDFMSGGTAGFASLDEAADAVSTYLPHRTRPKDTSGLARNLRLRDDGRYYWHWDPAFMTMGQDTAQPIEGPNRLEVAARALTLPTLLIRGGKSRILTEEGAREFLEMVPHADYVHIGSADHMVAGDANDAFNDAVFAFIEKQADTAAIPQG